MPTVQQAPSRQLVAEYQKRKDDPVMRTAIKRELNARGLAIAEEKRLNFVLPMWIGVGCFLVWVFLSYPKNNIQETKKTEVVHSMQKVEPKEIQYEKEIPQVEILKSQVKNLQDDVDQLEKEKTKLQEDLDKANGRLWSLAMLSQENWARIRGGSKEMIYMDEQWNPEKELTKVKNPERDKINEKIKHEK